MTDVHISIARDFSPYPAGRTRRDGEFSAQRFREEVLLPAYEAAAFSGDRVVVDLDGVFGYSSSFLEETFGGLVREVGGSSETIRRTLIIAAQDPIYASAKLDAEGYLEDELARPRRAA